MSGRMKLMTDGKIISMIPRPCCRPQVMVLLALVAICGLTTKTTTAFVSPRPRFVTQTRRFMAVQEQQQQQQQQQSEAERLQQEAQRIRLQAEQMDLNLTLEKIKSLESKLNNPAWLEKHPQQQDDLREQLQRLNQKLDTRNTSTERNTETEAAPFFQSSTSSLEDTATDTAPSSTTTTATTTSTTTTTTTDTTTRKISPSSLEPAPRNQPQSNTQVNKNIPPMAGFDQDVLDLYIPVAQDINKMVPNAPLQERLQLFQTAPELQKHFQEKITRLIMGPLEELQQLEDLKGQYLDSNSSNERRQLKTQIEKLEASLRSSGTLDLPGQNGGGGEIEISTTLNDIGAGGGAGGGGASLVGYSDTIRCGPDILPPLNDAELEERYQTIRALPDILIAIYKQRTGVVSGFNFISQQEESANGSNDDDDVTRDLKLAIQLDYYSLQLQLLEQSRGLDPFTDENRRDFADAFDSLPRPVQQCFAVQLGMKREQAKDCTAEQVLEVILKRDSPFSTMLQVVDTADAIAEPPEYNDIEFVDRSRYLEEFFPAVANMEGEHPKLEDVDLFVTECLSRCKFFMVTSKPERVIGGYYLRGRNQLTDDSESGSETASERLVQDISRRLQEHQTLKDKLDFFYILDPSPPSDEEMEMGEALTPILLVTTKDSKKLYQNSAPLTKSLVSLSGLASGLFFSVGCCVLNPAINDRLFSAMDAATASGATTPIDIQWLVDLCLPLYGSLLSILLVHEAAHRLVAAQYKFDIGPPNIIPSITEGVAGSITPFKSPPPNNKALFDFSLAGPLAGLVSSIALLYVGLEMTQSSSLDSALPVLPVAFVRSSSLGGGLVEYFLGKVALLPDQGPNAVVQLHPFAIAGFLGCLFNSLAMLPLGHTDGGRISLAMFGRRGAFVTKLFTTLLLTLAGLFGLDDNNILLAYVLYTLVWQRELETPIRNEVDEIDFSRGLLGITGALLVGLVLIPML